MAAEAARWRPEQAPAAAVAQWEAALQRLAAGAGRLRPRVCVNLSDPETLSGSYLLQLAAQAAAAAVPPLLPPGTRIALLVDQPTVQTLGDAAVVAHLEGTGRHGHRAWDRLTAARTDPAAGQPQAMNCS